MSASLSFFGCIEAELFSKEISASFEAVLRKNFVHDKNSPMYGFVSASVDGRYWTDTMWSRDQGTFMRELVSFGYIEEACALADISIRLVQKNEEGYYTFPEYVKPNEPKSGSELDGTTAIIISMVQLLYRLPADSSIKQRIEDFLENSASPLCYLLKRLEIEPLIAGTGEFGGGCGIEGSYYNVVQNALARLALYAAANYEAYCGNEDFSNKLTIAADQISKNIITYFKTPQNTWYWCLDTKTLKPDRTVNQAIINDGFGGINGVLSMLCDVEGVLLSDMDWEGVPISINTFYSLLNEPKHKELFEKYGMYTMFNRYMDGYFSGPSYGHGYAMQCMALLKRTDLLKKAVAYLAKETYQPSYPVTRENPYWFFERLYAPELVEREQVDEGCGALNLVCVSEPLKAARLMAGIDTTAPDCLIIAPELPDSFTGFDAKNFQAVFDGEIVPFDVTLRDGLLTIHTKNGRELPLVKVVKDGKTQEFTHVTELTV